MYHLCTTKMQKTCKIKRLVQEGSYIGIAAEPLESEGEAGIDGNERNLIALASKRLDQSVRLDSLATQDFLRLASRPP